MTCPFTLHTGDCLSTLADMPDNCFDAVVTDPPYGLGREPDALAMLRDWLTTGHHEVRGSGFMGKTWDAFVPQPVLFPATPTNALDPMPETEHDNTHDTRNSRRASTPRRKVSQS